MTPTPVNSTAATGVAPSRDAHGLSRNRKRSAAPPLPPSVAGGGWPRVWRLFAPHHPLNAGCWLHGRAAGAAVRATGRPQRRMPPTRPRKRRSPGACSDQRQGRTLLSDQPGSCGVGALMPLFKPCTRVGTPACTCSSCWLRVSPVTPARLAGVRAVRPPPPTASEDTSDAWFCWETKASQGRPLRFFHTMAEWRMVRMPSGSADRVDLPTARPISCLEVMK